MVAEVQAQACLSHMQVFFSVFPPFGLHVYSRVTSAVILRNPAMEKSNLILHFLKSNGRHFLTFLKGSIHAKGETWASPSKNGVGGAGYQGSHTVEPRKTSKAACLFFHTWTYCQRSRVTDAW